MIENYRFLKEIKGISLGTLYQVKNRKSGEYFLIKRINYPSKELYEEVLNSKDGNKEETDKYFLNKINSFINEFWKFTKINNLLKNTLNYYDIEISKNRFDKNTYNIDFLIENSTPINSYIESNIFVINDFFNLSLDTLKSVSSFHENGITLGNLELENIFINDSKNYLIDNPYFLKLLSLENSNIENNIYIAPEFYEEELFIEEKTDIYSLGIIFYELLNSGNKPFLDNDSTTKETIEVNNAITKLRNNILPSFSENINPNLKKLILKTLNSLDNYDSVEDLYNDLTYIRQSMEVDELYIKLFKNNTLNKEINKKNNIKTNEKPVQNSFKDNKQLTTDTASNSTSAYKKREIKNIFIPVTLLLLFTFVQLIFINQDQINSKNLNNQTVSENELNTNLINYLNKSTSEFSKETQYELIPIGDNNYINSSDSILVHTSSENTDIIIGIEIIKTTKYTIADLAYNMSFSEAKLIFNSDVFYINQIDSSQTGVNSEYSGRLNTNQSIIITISFDEYSLLKKVSATYSP